mmetsp:Transcript_5058/g.11547  ORF Transcript_5058/g.11547 Transcript_5058/m.11547 type:complete len:216 (+) Transcript_5058:88-735(+)
MGFDNTCVSMSPSSLLGRLFRLLWECRRPNRLHVIWKPLLPHEVARLVLDVDGGTHVIIGGIPDASFRASGLDFRPSDAATSGREISQLRHEEIFLGILPLTPARLLLGALRLRGRRLIRFQAGGACRRRCRRSAAEVEAATRLLRHRLRHRWSTVVVVVVASRLGLFASTRTWTSSRPARRRSAFLSLALRTGGDVCPPACWLTSARLCSLVLL